LFQERVRFSHNIQRRLGGFQIAFPVSQLALQPGNLSLFLGGFANGLTGVSTIKHACIALFAPLDDLGGIQPIGAKIRAALLCLDRLIVGLQVLQFFGDADHSAAGFIGGTISAHAPIIRHCG
jgi:hypothetical protein